MHLYMLADFLVIPKLAELLLQNASPRNVDVDAAVPVATAVVAARGGAAAAAAAAGIGDRQ